MRSEERQQLPTRRKKVSHSFHAMQKRMTALLLLAGCNQIAGIEPGRPFPVQLGGTSGTLGVAGNLSAPAHNSGSGGTIPIGSAAETYPSGSAGTSPSGSAAAGTDDARALDANGGVGSDGTRDTSASGALTGAGGLPALGGANSPSGTAGSGSTLPSKSAAETYPSGSAGTSPFGSAGASTVENAGASDASGGVGSDDARDTSASGTPTGAGEHLAPGGANSASGAVAGEDAYGGRGSDNISPVLVASSPAGHDVEPTEPIVARFSEALDCSTVTAASFVIKDVVNSSIVPGKLTCSGAEVTFEAPQGLPLAGDCSVKLTAMIADRAGNSLSNAPITWTFGVREGRWGPVQCLGDTFGSSEPTPATNATGDAMVVWSRSFDTSHANVCANRYVNASSSWTGAEVVHGDASEYSGVVTVGADALGNYIAAWTQAVPGFGANNKVWVERYTAGLGWGNKPSVLSTDDTTNAIALSLAVEPNGNAVLLWEQVVPPFNEPASTGWGSRYTAMSNSWSVAKQFASNLVGIDGPSVAMDSRGFAMGVYSSTSRSNIGSVSWDQGKELAIGSAIESTTSISPSTGEIVRGDENGNFIALWTRPSDPEHQIGGNRWSAASQSWGSANSSPKATSTRIAGKPDLAVNASGQAIAVWVETDNDTSDIRSSYLPASGPYWGPSMQALTGELVYPPNAFANSTPRVAIDANGNAIAIWSRFDHDTYQDSVWFTRCHGSADWADPVRLSDSAVTHAINPRIAMLPSGRSLVVWAQSSGDAWQICARWFR